MDLLESIFARLLNAIILLPTWQDWINAAALGSPVLMVISKD
jgi:hypothetical protein